MGKDNFDEIYLQACHELLPAQPSIKVSFYSDDYDPNMNYAGIILYSHKGAFKWKHQYGSIASGENCRFLYVYIKCTDSWSGNDFKRAGEGMVHENVRRHSWGQFQSMPILLWWIRCYEGYTQVQ